MFPAPQALKVLWGVTEIGTIDVTFAQQEKLENLSFVLGARPWRAVAIDFEQGVRVEPIPVEQARAVAGPQRCCAASCARRCARS